MNQLVRTPIGNGVYFNSISDPKFKHNRMSVNFVMPLDKNAVSHNAVVPYTLRMGCKNLPDFSSLNARLQELYGATLDAHVSKFGGYQVLEVSLRALDNRYALEGEDITAECAKLLADVVLEPKLGADGLLDEKDIALQKQYVLDTIEAEINDKRSYAISQCIKAMCQDEPVAVRSHGDAETAETITRDSATKAYYHMLRVAPVEIMFTGSGDCTGAKTVFEKAFAPLERQPGGYPLVKLRSKAEQVQEKTETMDIAQGKLVMGLRTGLHQDQRSVNAARIFSALYGGAPFSKLFLNVREKLSLCYYCAARFDSTTHLLMVDSGVEPENKQKAVDEIMVQLKAVTDGDFTDEEVKQTKMLLKSALMATTDSPGAIEGWYIAQILRGRTTSPHQDAADLEEITREEIIAAAKQVTLDTVYFLTGKEDTPQ